MNCQLQKHRPEEGVRKSVLTSSGDAEVLQDEEFFKLILEQCNGGSVLEVCVHLLHSGHKPCYISIEQSLLHAIMMKHACTAAAPLLKGPRAPPDWC